MRITVSTKKTRKELASFIAQATGNEVSYSGVPKCEYHIGDITVLKDGNVETENKTIAEYLKAISSADFQFEFEETQVQESEEKTHGISRPRSSLTEKGLENLKQLISAKSRLLQKALGRTDIEVNTSEDSVLFPWLDGNEDEDTAKAVTELADRMFSLAKNSQRITAKEKETDNEKYTFRCFLLRLGFIGDEYKISRKILLQNFEGSSAFKTVRKDV